jgi:hypothetical protein
MRGVKPHFPYVFMAWYFIMDGDDLLKPTKVKVKFTLEQATRTQGGADVYLYSSFNLGGR